MRPRLFVASESHRKSVAEYFSKFLFICRGNIEDSTVAMVHLVYVATGVFVEVVIHHVCRAGRMQLSLECVWCAP